MAKKDAAAAAARKARKREELARALAAQATLKRMEESASTDVLAVLPPSFRAFTRPDGLDLAIVAAPSHAALPPPTAAALFDLVAANMADVYKRAGFGWDPAAKKKELADPAARFLLAYHRADVPGGGGLPPSALPVAFVHYRLEMEAPAAPTLYVYEVQAAAPVRRRGLGKFLMLALEMAARKGGLAQLMLTVQAGNSGAERLYAGLGFVADPSSPGPGEGPGGRDPGYTILSKQLPPPKAAAVGVAATDTAATVISGGRDVKAGSGGAAGAAAAAAGAAAAAL